MLKQTVIVLSLSSFLLSACVSSKKEWHVSDQEAYQFGYEFRKATICINNSKELDKEAKKLKDPQSGQKIISIVQTDIMNYVLSKSRGKPVPEYVGGLALALGDNNHKNHIINEGYNDAAKERLTKEDCSHIDYSKYANEIRHFIQKEKEEKAKQEFYATPQGQAYLAQQRQQLETLQMMQNSQPRRNPLSELNQSLDQLNQTIDKHRTRVTNCYGGSYGNSATCYTY